jgi:hypothetical protein
MPKRGSHMVRRNPQRKRLARLLLANDGDVKKVYRQAGYGSPQAANTAIRQMVARGEMVEELSKIGWSPREFAKKHLARMLERKKTVYFQNGGIVTDKRVVEDTEAQQRAAEMYLKIFGGYAPVEVEHTGTLFHELTESEKRDANESLARIRVFEAETGKELEVEHV